MPVLTYPWSEGSRRVAPTVVFQPILLQFPLGSLPSLFLLLQSRGSFYFWCPGKKLWGVRRNDPIGTCRNRLHTSRIEWRLILQQNTRHVDNFPLSVLAFCTVLKVEAAVHEGDRQWRVCARAKGTAVSDCCGMTRHWHRTSAPKTGFLSTSDESFIEAHV
ncbi:hypothetical protein CB1_000955006 [Camelus ferus]|nr:hypothetical protein CB1_000955006 [Camelus ferus]